ncbi:hypothetical protein Hanom_Chr04g00295351 [Helianthus anomalus]
MTRYINLNYIIIRFNYMVSPCGLHKVTYLSTNSLKSLSRVLTFHFVTYGGINVNCLSPSCAENVRVFSSLHGKLIFNPIYA